MRTLSVNADKAEIKNLVVEWLELLAQEKYAEALEIILYDNTQEVDGTLWTWTPQNLEAAVFTYGMPWFTKEEMKKRYGEDCKVDYKVTSVLARPDKEELLEKIDVLFFDNVVTDEMAKTWGIEKLDYKNIIGDVICDCVLLDGELSDLSALFWMQKTDDENMTIIFRDLHVM